jgi:hypothetical protein
MLLAIPAIALSLAIMAMRTTTTLADFAHAFTLS